MTPHFHVSIQGHPSAEEALDAVSVRFTDLIAAESQQQLLAKLRLKPTSCIQLGIEPT